MVFNSLDFMVFFPIVFLVYCIVPKRVRYIWLLLSSYYFYMCWNAKYALLLLCSTIITWLGGLLIERCKNKQKNCRYIVLFSFVINLVILVFFKYFDFVLENINHMLNSVGGALLSKPYDIILPIGISFYTFQALGYTVDVYRGDVKAERNILKYALFVSFFPQLAAGPIERAGNMMNQIENCERITICDLRRVASGIVLIFWGLFQKMVIADRVAILVNTVFNSYYMYHSYELVVGAVAYALQIYCDFASYSTIAMGVAKVIGFNVMENFNAPYFAMSIQEFWRRWHISLSTWFRDYLYIPLGGNRCSKFKKYRNLMITFLVSGLWHGASWTYILWGGLHGIYQIIGAELMPIKEKINKVCNTKTDCFSYKLGRVIITFVLVDLAWIFFRSSTVHDAVYYIQRMFVKWNPWALFDGTLYTLGLNRFNMNILIVCCIVLFLVDCLQYFKHITIDKFLEAQSIWFRWGVLIILILSIVIYGMYGPQYSAQQFIYFQF